MPRVLQPTEQSIKLAATALRAGEVVAVPTETVYGLAADALNERAVQRVFELKGRPSGNPLIVHVRDAAQAKELVAKWDPRCEKLAALFWPGPLTLVLPKSPAVPDVVTAGFATVAVRAPAHPVMQALLREFGGAIAAPSANRSSHLSPTAAEHVAAEFASEANLIILDGGPCEVGIESTVLDMTTDPPRVLRPGGLTIEQLRKAIDDVEHESAKNQVHSPGTSPRHYAPRTPCELLTHEALVARLASKREPVAVLTFDPALATIAECVVVLSRDAERYAAMLYNALRMADASGADRILIERPVEQGGLWTAILDRLERATTPR